ncbi:hypothetical protein HOP50_02g16150 [Chloropicon primus]|nr:hypothetical protein HOP50_02g16150 [Chloropicon primus]
MVQAHGGVGEKLWYYIEIVETDDVNESPVKRVGPLNLGELKQIYQGGKLNDETYMWCDGMGEEFKQLKDIAELRSALMTGEMSDAPIGISNNIDLQRASWYYKDKMGAKQGPTVFNTLKLIWDFGDDVDESTPVFTDGMDKFYPISQIPSLYKALAFGQVPASPVGGLYPEQNTLAEAVAKGANVELEQKRQLLEAKEAELKAREESVNLKEAATPADGRDNRPYAFTETRRRTRRTPYSGPPRRPAADLTESELDDESDAQVTRVSSMPGYDSVISDVETENPIFGRLKGKSSQFVNGERRGLFSTRKVGQKLILSGVDASDSETVETVTRRSTRSSKKSSSARKTGMFKPLSKNLTWSSSHRSGRVGGPMTDTSQNAQSSIYNVFQEEMRTLEEEYSKCRVRLEQEYEEQHEVLGKRLDAEARKVQELQMQSAQLQKDYEQGVYKMQREYKLFQKEKKVNQEEVNKMKSHVEAIQLKAEEERKSIMAHAEKLEGELQGDKEKQDLEWESLKKEKKRLEDAKKALLAEKKHIEHVAKDEREDTERERTKLEEDMKAFQEYKEEVEKFLEVQQNIMKTEQEEFIKSRASELAKLNDLQGAAQNEKNVFEQRIKEFEKDRAMQEYDYTQKDNYLDIHHQKLETDRRNFEEYRAQMEAELEGERKKLSEHIATLEAREQMNRDLLDTDKRKLLREKEALIAEVQSEKARIDEQRIEQARKTVEMQQQIRRLQDQLVAIHPNAGRMYSQQEVSAPPTLPAASFTPSGRTFVKVYVHSGDDSNYLGNVELVPTVTLGDLRGSIKDKFSLPPSFKLKRRKIPIRPAQDHHLATDFLKSNDDFLVVDY